MAIKEYSHESGAANPPTLSERMRTFAATRYRVLTDDNRERAIQAAHTVITTPDDEIFNLAKAIDDKSIDSLYARHVTNDRTPLIEIYAETEEKSKEDAARGSSFLDNFRHSVATRITQIGIAEAESLDLLMQQTDENKNTVIKFNVAGILAAELYTAFKIDNLAEDPGDVQTGVA